ncbi:hypothetical protein [Streptomyces macrosporus]|uniref:Uncharacterized protein n=1 Tax=Streptomyces macrosporus TaxID=44032 RepID=A0ABN3KGP1_9ACTN
MNAYLDHRPEPGRTVFDVRLGLTLLDTVGSTEHPVARRLADALHRRVADARDGHAARELPAHPLLTTLATHRQAQDCADLVQACALGTGTIPSELHDALSAALHTSDAERPLGSANPSYCR